MILLIVFNSTFLFFIVTGSEFFGVFAKFCNEEGIVRTFSTTKLKAFKIESWNQVLKLYIERILDFQRHRKWTSILEQAVKIYNSTPQSSLLGNSPDQASSDPDIIAQLQAYNLRKRANRAKTFKNEKPAYKVGELVKIVEVDPFRQRVTTKRFSKENYKIRKVVNSVPITYKLSEIDGTKLTRTFYKQELALAEDHTILNASVQAKRILAIIEKKDFPTKFLRSGKPLSFETRYLVKSNEKEEAFYLKKADFADYDNGTEMLENYLKSKENGISQN